MSQQAESPALGLPLAFAAFGDRWSVIILHAVHDGHHTFGELRRELGISDGVLAARLARLTTHGMLERVRYQQRPPRWHYQQTAATHGLWLSGIAIWQWDQKWLPIPPRVDVQLIHTECSRSTVPIFGCGACGAGDVTMYDVRMIFDKDLPRQMNLSSATRAVRLAARPYFDALTLLGDHWSTSILAATLAGARTFSELRTALARISTATLSERLRWLVVCGLLRTAPGDGQRRKLYLLTPRSRDFFPIFATMNNWARLFAAETGLHLEHIACGSELAPQFACGSCNRVMGGTTTVFHNVARDAPWTTSPRLASDESLHPPEGGAHRDQ